MSKKPDLAAILKNIDFAKVMAFLRQRWILLTCGLVVVIAPVGAWFGQGMLQADIDKAIKDRASLHDQLNGFRKGTVTIRMPDGTSKDESAAINDAIINRIREHNEALGKTSGAIYLEALRRNHGEHALMPGLDEYLPKPVRGDEATRDILLQKWEQFVRPARQQLTSDPAIRGPVPASDALARAQGAEQQFLSVNRVSKRSDVPAAELPKLVDALRETRIQAAIDHAAGLQFYLDRNAIRWQPRPGVKADATAAAASDEWLRFMFREQWDLWLVSDLFKAFRGLNARTPGGPLKSPIKRIILISMKDYPSRPAEGQTQADTGDAGEAIDPQKEVTLDFKMGGLMGLVSNQLYDVRDTTVLLVIETAAVPALVNELARVNFISVDDIKLQPVDAFAALRQGYVYGPRPCSEIELSLKSVWLREWTTERMPVAMLKAIKSAGKPKPEGGDAANPAAAGQ